jgi:hypothetical protein
MNEPISGALDRLTTEGGRMVVVLRAQAQALIESAWARVRRLMRASPNPDPVIERRNEPISGALVKLTNEGRRAILALPAEGRALG